MSGTSRRANLVGCILCLVSGCAVGAARELPQPMVLGEVVSLHDPRFSEKNAARGLWHAHEAVRVTPPGVYFLEPYSRHKTPVLFVHGINGSPADFDYLIGRLDRTRFQAWVYSYPSGSSLDVVASHLERTMAELQDQLLFRHFGVVGHSMGGLVARGFILRYERLARVTDVPLFVSISTPWGGHSAASLGKRFARQVDVWRDLVPGSRYLRDLFTTSLPQATRYYLLFTFNRNKASLGTSDDHTVTVASQLVLRAQDEAVRTIGYDDTHAGVLFDANVANLLDALLDEAFQEGSP